MKIAKQMTMALAAVAAMSMSSVAQAPTRDIVDTAVNAGSFSTLSRLLTEAGLVATLKGAGPFTVFAPTDEAFSRLPRATLEKVGADRQLLTRVLTYHVVPGRVLAADVARLREATTVQGGKIRISVRNNRVRLNNNTNVTATDIRATNGVIHVIDRVLMPPAEETRPARSN